tara:strand:+ start:1739 stop:2509 length:771 start_codon:yes stop_codon:yes gene_type:complete
MAPWNESTRRYFLKASGIGLGTLVLGCPSNRKPKSKISGQQDGGETTTARFDAGNSQTSQVINDAGGEQATNHGDDAGPEDLIDCEQTANDIEGPFYRPNVPVRSELDLYGDAGTELTLSGRVLDLDCNPIPNAVVDIWHADPTDVPVADLVDSDSVDYDNTSSEMRYRGQTATDAEGRYSFHTKKPGWYLNGGTFRPMHIHVKVWVGDNLKLTSQLYFAGDPYISGDPWASLDRAVVLSADGPGAEKGTFNFVIS